MGLGLGFSGRGGNSSFDEVIGKRLGFLDVALAELGEMLSFLLLCFPLRFGGEGPEGEGSGGFLRKDAMVSCLGDQGIKGPGGPVVKLFYPSRFSQRIASGLAIV